MSSVLVNDDESLVRFRLRGVSLLLLLFGVPLSSSSSLVDGVDVVVSDFDDARSSFDDLAPTTDDELGFGFGAGI